MTAAQQKAGTKDLGREYELMMAARATLILLLDPNIADIKITTNDDSYGKFDDIVTSVVFRDGTQQTIAVQLKHKENAKKSLLAASVETPKGDFSIEQYYQSYKTEIRDKLKEKKCHFVLYTNASFVGQQRLQRFEMTSCESCPGAVLLRTGGQGKIYSFREKEGSGGDEARSRFLQSFSLYCNQASLNELQESTKSEFMASLKCGEECWLKYLNFFRALFNGDYTRPALSRDEILFQIMYFSLRSFVVEFNREHEETTTFIKKLSSSCDIVVVGDCRGCVTKGLEGKAEAVGEDFIKRAKEFKLLTKTARMGNVSREDVFRLRWYLGEEPPLISVDADSTEPVLTMIERLFDRPRNTHKFLLIADIPRQEFGHLSVIRDLSDIKDKNAALYREEVLKWNISLQGRPDIPLGQLFETLKGDDLNGILTVHEALLMREGQLTVGQSTRPRLVESHIGRIVLHKFVSTKIAKDTCVLQQALIILTKSLELADAAVEFVTIEGFFRKSGSILGLQVIVEEDLQMALKRFQDICRHLVRNTGKRNVYLFRNIDEYRLELVRSCGSVEILRQFLRCYSKIRVAENDAVAMALEKGTVVICAKPGMGKTVFINRFAAQCPVDFWIVQLALREHTVFFNNLPECDEDILGYLIGTSYEKGDLISEAVSAKFKDCGKVIFLFDGVDELPSQCVKSALQCMEIVSKLGFCQVVTSRNNLKQLLEEHLGLLSGDLADVVEEDQDWYIEKRLGGKFSQVDIEYRVASVRENRTIAKNNDALGVPLQLYMLTEILLKSSKRTLFEDEADPFMLTNMYEQFFSGKYEHFKAKTDVDAEKILPYTSDSLKHRTRLYQIAALTSCLDTAHLKIIESSLGPYFAKTYKKDCNTFFEQCNIDGDPFGVIDGIVDGAAVYVHQTYAEFFTASFLSENCTECPDIQQFIFARKYDNVRLMFDMLLAKHCPGHIAVLYRDLQKFRSLPEHIVRMKDEAGRNALHLLSSWGKNYNSPAVEMSQEANGDICWVRNRYIEQTLRDSKPDLMAQELVSMFDCTEVDKLYLWSAASYAERTMSLSVLDEIAGTCGISAEALRNSANKYNILVCSIVGRFWNLFNIMDVRKLPLIRAKNLNSPEFTVLDLAAEYATTKYIEPLLENQFYKSRITIGTVELAVHQRNCHVIKLLLEKSTIVNQPHHGDLLHSVTMYESAFDKDIADLLLSMGADINSRIPVLGTTCFLYACGMGSLEVGRYLVEKGADISATDRYGFNALLLASRMGHLEMVQFLFEHGSFDPLRRDINRISAMSAAIAYGHLEVVKYFLNEGKCKARILADHREYVLHLRKIKKPSQIEAFLLGALSAAEEERA